MNDGPGQARSSSLRTEKRFTIPPNNLASRNYSDSAVSNLHELGGAPEYDTDIFKDFWMQWDKDKLSRFAFKAKHGNLSLSHCILS